MNELPYQFAWLLWAHAGAMREAMAAGNKARMYAAPSPVAPIVAVVVAHNVAAAGLIAVRNKAQEKPWLRLMK